MAYVLLVDDEPDLRGALCRYLQRAGLEVQCVSNGNEALASVLARCPDCMVLDLLMPQMGGLELLKIVRSYSRLQTMPVVILTGLPGGIERKQEQELHATTLMKGRASLADVLSAIQRQLPA